MKGGVGKTTLAVSLAWHFHKEGSDVLLVDLDPQFNATQYVMDYKSFEAHRKKAGTIADLLIDQPKLDLRLKKVKKNPAAALHRAANENGKKFDLLPAELSLAHVVKNPAQMDYRLEKLLEKLTPHYDYVFIDCAPTDSVLTTMALSASDFLLIPMRPDQFSILGFTNLTNTIEAFRRNCEDPHKVKVLGVVFTQVTGSSQAETDLMNEIAITVRRDKTHLFTSSLQYSTSFIRSVKDQTPISHTVYARQKTRNAVKKIADELRKRVAALVPTPGKGKP
jgi:chromosome partitioning protein